MIALPRVMGALLGFSTDERRFATMAAEPGTIAVRPRKVSNKAKKWPPAARLRWVCPIVKWGAPDDKGHGTVTIWERSHGSIDFSPTLPGPYGSAPGDCGTSHIQPVRCGIRAGQRPCTPPRSRGRTVPHHLASRPERGPG